MLFRSVSQSRYLRANYHQRQARQNLTVNPLKSAQAFHISWNEFWDMHVLFHTSYPSFMYMSGQAMEALKWLNQFWNEKKDGPIVTMDAGSNIHLLYREDQHDIYQFVFDSLKNHFSFWTDEGYVGKN